MSEIDKFDTFDLSNLEKGFYKIGKLTMNIIDLLGLETEEKEIIIWSDRVDHLEKHKNDFDNDEQFYKHVEAIPDIVQNPDYVGIHPNGGSIEFIKLIEKNVMVAVRINNSKKLAFRTCYPISDNKFEKFKASGRIRKV